MKRFPIPAFFAPLLLVAALAWGGCSSEPSTPATGTPGDSAASGNGSLVEESGTRYSWKIEPGFSWKIKSLETVTVTTNPGASNEDRTESSTTINCKANLRDVDKEMAMNIGLTYKDVVKGGGKGAKGKNAGSDAGDPRLGKTLDLRMEPSTGQILDLRGAEPIFKEDGLEALGELADALYREAYDNDFYIYPDGPVEVGGSWERNGRLRLPYGLKVKHTYTLDKQMSGQGFIKRVSELREGDMVPGMAVSYNLNGTASADFNVDDATGLIYSKVENTTLEGTMTKDGTTTPVRIEISSISEMTLQ